MGPNCLRSSFFAFLALYEKNDLRFLFYMSRKMPSITYSTIGLAVKISVRLKFSLKNVDFIFCILSLLLPGTIWPACFLHIYIFCLKLKQIISTMVYMRRKSLFKTLYSITCYSKLSRDWANHFSYARVQIYSPLQARKSVSYSKSFSYNRFLITSFYSLYFVYKN